MPENINSRLNPLAMSFIPSKRAETSSVREIAEKYVNELVERKRARGEKCLTKLEMANLVGKLISLRFKASTPADLAKINSYLTSKILSRGIPDMKLQSGTIFRKATHSKFALADLSAVQLPKQTFLLTAFWGLYRQDQALRPLLSLTYRLDIVKDKIWSVESSDKKLWNPSCNENVCICPPIFGYIIPSVFFGNPSYLHYSCSEERIHLNHYSESSDGNEFILTNNWSCNIIEDQPFEEEDFGSSASTEIDLNSLKDYFETTVTSICGLLAKYEESDDTSQNDEANDIPSVSYWDEESDFKKSYIPFSEQIRNLVDDDEHPLLEVTEFPSDEGVSLEIEEIIRRSLSPKKDHLSSGNIAFEDVEIKEEKEEVICDPPCSVWCNSPRTSDDKEKITEIKDSDAETPSDGVPLLDLLYADQLSSSKDQDSEKPKIVYPKSSLNPSKSKVPRPIFRRAFSVNDCDPYYYDSKFGLSSTLANTTGSLSSKDMFAFLRKDPVNFFKTFNRSNSWKDTDSGFVSHWSSQEDMNGSDSEDQSTMWGLISGNDSLWQPLPECESRTTTEEEKTLTHKRVRDLRRQRSLN